MLSFFFSVSEEKRKLCNLGRGCFERCSFLIFLPLFLFSGHNVQQKKKGFSLKTHFIPKTKQRLYIILSYDLEGFISVICTHTHTHQLTLYRNAIQEKKPSNRDQGTPFFSASNPSIAFLLSLLSEPNLHRRM